MKLGFIVGKVYEICDNEELRKLTPKKYLRDTWGYTKLLKDRLHVDVAIAMTVKLKFPGHTVDIILPREIDVARLKQNDINFVLGFDYISIIEKFPLVRKFQGDKGKQLLRDIYKNPNSKIFPPYKHQNFIWNKQSYLTTFQKAGVPINPTLFINQKVNIPKLIQQIKQKKWSQFIIKPIGGSCGLGCDFFTLSDVEESPGLLLDYFVENSESYTDYLVQQITLGFKQYGEIKSFWIGGKFSYAINTKGSSDDPTVVPVTDKKELTQCKKLGTQVVEAIPPLFFQGKKTTPVMTRIDMLCCLNNKPKSRGKYFLNEIEEGGLAGSYTDFKGIDYPIVEVMADAYVKKAEELLN